MIGIVIPGSPIITSGPIISSNIVVDVYNPKIINNISLFLIDPIPNDFGVALYYSVPPFQTTQFLGFVSNQKPSDIFYTGWSLDPYVNIYQSIKIGIKMESLKNIKTSFEEKITKNDNNKEFPKRLAKNLYNYLDSFNLNQDYNRKLLAVPVNSIINWYNKFVKKYMVDPGFLMKSDDY